MRMVKGRSSVTGLKLCAGQKCGNSIGFLCDSDEWVVIPAEAAYHSARGQW